MVETTIREGKAELQLHKERLVAKAKWNLLHLSGLLLLALSMIVAVPVGTVLLLLGASNGLGMLTSPWVGQIGVALLLMLGLGLWLIVARRSISESFRKSVQDRWESLESEATGSTSS